MNTFITTLKLSLVFTFLQMLVTYLPFVLAKAGKKETIRKLIPLKPIDFIFSWLYMFALGLILSRFEKVWSVDKTHSFIDYLQGWLYGIILNSYFFIVHPFVIHFQRKRYIPSALQIKYRDKFNNSIPVYTTSFNCINAFAMGILPFGRIIVIGNKMIENLEEAEQFAVLAHEQAHHKHKDILSFFGIFSFSLLCWGIGKLQFTRWLTFQFPTIDHGLITGIYGSLNALIFYVVIFSKISHRAEYRADNLAAHLAGKKI